MKFYRPNGCQNPLKQEYEIRSAYKLFLHHNKHTNTMCAECGVKCWNRWHIQ